MASIFTYDPDPPRVASPWREPIVDPEKKPSTENLRLEDHAHDQLSDYGVDKLDSEPQDGPIEYKLHLLLRPRRTYTVMNTPDADPKVPRAKGSSARRSPQVLAPSTQSRQARLEQLTTQLLWRLQQTTPFHTATSNDMVIPRLPDDTVDLSEPVKAATLLPGLEASRGALYEIGVADDGSIKGLTMDEMVDSINTLKIMAASLGCYVEIRRKILVGDCAWTESSGLVDNPVQPPEEVTRTARLWVYEALVMPDLGPRQGSPQPHSNDPSKGKPQETVVVPRIPSSTTTQLRVTLTGPTTSGKSSLLGTLSTGTLDNGRGMSRLSLLKHRHEVASGITSSVAQELIGYEERTIINYADRNIESWLDIHDRSQQGRLVFVSDSAGHPRYRRTILRGIVGWAPHWTILCIAGDEIEAVAGGIGTTAAARDILGEDGASVDLSMAHLDLCLKLEAPLAILITKVDLPTRANLRKTLGKILTAIKDRGRVPKLVAPGRRRQDLTEIPMEDEREVQAVWDEMAKTPRDLLRVVPMVLTSAVRGDGIYQTHALLKGLPLPPTPTAYDYTGLALDPDQPTSLFHIDDKFNLPASYASLAPRKADRGDVGIVVSGYLRFGKFSVGDRIVLGPFPAEEQDDAQGLTPDPVGQGSPSRGLSISHRSYAELSRIAQRNAISASTIKGEWHTAQIVSIRNLRLPVYTLEAGQAGSIGIVLDVGEEQAVPRVRKGMVLAALRKHMTDGAVSMQAASGFTLSCQDPAAATLTVGSLVNVYVASVRAAAKVTNVVTGRPDRTSKPDPVEEEANDVFNLTEEMETESGANNTRNQCIEVTLELLTNREWIEMGSKAVLLEGGRRDKSGLEAIVGQVVEVVD